MTNEGIQWEPSQFEGELASFSILPHGWHYGDGGPIPSRVIVAARSLAKAATIHGASSVDAFPGTDGEVLLEVSGLPVNLEILINRNEEISVIAEELGSGDVIWEAAGLSVQAAIVEILAVGGGRWSSSGSSIRNTGASGGERFLASHFGIQQAAESPSWIRSAPSTRQATFVVTYDTSTAQGLPEIHQSTGGSIRTPRSQQRAA